MTGFPPGRRRLVGIPATAPVGGEMTPGGGESASGPDGWMWVDSAGLEAERWLGGRPCLPARKACMRAWMSWEMDKAEGGRRAAAAALSGVDELDRTEAVGGEEPAGRTGSGARSESVEAWASGEAAMSGFGGSTLGCEAGSAMAHDGCKAASSRNKKREERGPEQCGETNLTGWRGTVGQRADGR
jgi:hypothetical protein